jgi:tetratricopeptide (TPR) repeat protein
MAEARMIERRHMTFMLVLLAALSAPIAPARAQSSDDVAALDRQVDQLVQQGNYVEATNLALRALAASERQLGDDHPGLAVPLRKLASLYQYQGRYDQAEPLYRRSLAINEKALGPDDPDVAAGREILAKLYRIQGRYRDAEPLLNGALSAREKVSGRDSVEVCRTLYHLAALYETQGRYADAEPYRRRCLDIRESTLGADHAIVGQSLHELARLYRMLGREQATSLYDRAMAALGPNHPEAVLAAINAGEYVKAVRALGLGPEAASSEAIAQQRVRRTFFGQVTDLRWTGYSYADRAGVSLRNGLARATTELRLEGEAIHGNGLWQPFSATMLPEGSEWKLRSIALLGLAWKQQP